VLQEKLYLNGEFGRLFCRIYLTYFVDTLIFIENILGEYVGKLTRTYLEFWEF